MLHPGHDLLQGCLFEGWQPALVRFRQGRSPMNLMRERPEMFGIYDHSIAVFAYFGLSFEARPHHNCKWLAMTNKSSKRCPYRRWTPKEDKLLASASDPEIGRRLGRSKASVQQRRRTLHVAAHRPPRAHRRDGGPQPRTACWARRWTKKWPGCSAGPEVPFRRDGWPWALLATFGPATASASRLWLPWQGKL